MCVTRVLTSYTMASALFRVPACKTSRTHPHSKHGTWLIMSSPGRGQAGRVSNKGHVSSRLLGRLFPHCIKNSNVDWFLPIRRPQRQTTVKGSRSQKLENCKLEEECSSDVDGRLLETSQDDHNSTGEQWSVFRDAVYSYCLWRPRISSKYKPKTGSIRSFLFKSEKCHLLRVHQNNPMSHSKEVDFARAGCKLQTKHCEMQDELSCDKADDIQGYADNHDTETYMVRWMFSVDSWPLAQPPFSVQMGTPMLTVNKRIWERWS